MNGFIAVRCITTKSEKKYEGVVYSNQSECFNFKTFKYNWNIIDSHTQHWFFGVFFFFHSAYIYRACCVVLVKNICFGRTGNRQNNSLASQHETSVTKSKVSDFWVHLIREPKKGQESTVWIFSFKIYVPLYILCHIQII